MRIDELESYINVGRDRSACVDITSLTDIPGYVRSVTIHKDYLVTIRYRRYGASEGGVSYSKKYRIIERMIKELERFLNKPLEDWENFNKTGRYPELLHSEQEMPSFEELKQITQQKVPKGYKS